MILRIAHELGCSTFKILFTTGTKFTDKRQIFLGMQDIKAQTL